MSDRSIEPDANYIDQFLEQRRTMILKKQGDRDVRIDITRSKEQNPSEGSIDVLVSKFKKGDASKVDYAVRIYFSTVIQRWIVEKMNFPNHEASYDDVKRFRDDFGSYSSCLDIIEVDSPKKEEEISSKKQGCSTFWRK